MQPPSIDVYVAAFVARCDVMRRPGGREVDEPGVRGLLSSPDDPRIRLLVTDDRACDVLAALLPDAGAGTINVFAAAARCAELVAGHPAWKSKAVTAMICRDLQAVPAVLLPSELAFRAVRRLVDDPPEGVPLDDAVALAMQRIRRSTTRSPPTCARCRPRSGSSPRSTATARCGRRPAPARSARRRTCSSSTPTPTGAAAASGGR